jgi:site-specific DNA-cytosine methylase
MKKIILDLCGGTGAWSKPYKDAGYDVRLITLPNYDVRTYQAPENVYGILAAPPCTMFSFARTRAKKPRDLKEGMEIVNACLKIIWQCQYEYNQKQTGYKTSLKFWALENPNGFLKYFLGKPAFVFQPYEFDDPYSKLTHLWGWFNEPHKISLKLVQKKNINQYLI